MNSSEVILPCGELRIVFERYGDRVRHRIERQHDGRLETLAISDEGDGANAWPPSPPFQSLHIEPRTADCQVAFLVGMAGNSHWSGSISANRATGRAEFDIACRLSTMPGALGSQYRIATPLADETSQIRFTASMGTLCSRNGALQITPQLPTVQSPTTVRWTYAILPAE